MTALYNEIEPYAARWLDNLINAGHIARGVVDARSITELRTADLMGRTQCHFFAGIGVWSHALRLAGWSDDREVWTGSCPCQPFSAAGKGGGFADERHLWPTWFALIRECRPSVVFGEQVASPDGLKWLDLVHADLEGAGYAVGVADLCAAGVGAPHIRQRLYFVAYAQEERRGTRRAGKAGNGRRPEQPPGFGATVDVADADGQRLEGERVRLLAGQPRSASAQVARRCAIGKLGDASSERSRRNTRAVPRKEASSEGEGRGARRVADEFVDAGTGCELADATIDGWNKGDALGYRSRGGETSTEWRPRSAHDDEDGFWSGADWIPCSDGVSRPVEPGTFPLAHGAAGRVGRLRAYGNAIVAQVAATFIRAAMESIHGLEAEARRDRA